MLVRVQRLRCAPPLRVDTPEKRARQQIDAALNEAGWRVQSRDAVNLNAARGVAVREFQLKGGYVRPEGRTGL